MKGLYFVRKGVREAISGDLSLILRLRDMEIMRQHILPSSVAWICPSVDPMLTEVFFVTHGSLSVIGDDMRIDLGVGDCFYTDGLTDDVCLQAYEPTDLLYIVNSPQYDDLSKYHQILLETSTSIDEKDSRTLSHSQRVMKLCVLILRELNSRDISIDDLVAASLFHDVGKCYVPDEILKKQSRITPQEYECIKRHPVDSEEILLRFYGANAARLARWHHERLDGSGYPDHLTGDDIPLGARILAVADSFEAMTAGRPYAPLKTYGEAMDELLSMTTQYDGRVTQALNQLVTSSRFSF